MMSPEAEMFQTEKSADREKNYRLMVETAKAFIQDENDVIALLANISALIMVYVDDLIWAGFYLLKGTELVLGPFQGKPACTRIGEGKGVCGKAVIDARPVRVDDVHKFPGHIACDSASVSELVIPVFKDGKVCGVLDMDSALPARFSDLETEYLGRIAELLSVFLEGKTWK
jgi:GAF domain-containing protein